MCILVVKTPKPPACVGILESAGVLVGDDAQVGLRRLCSLMGRVVLVDGCRVPPDG